MNKEGKKIMLINFLILVIYSIGFSFLDDGSYLSELIPLIFKAYAVGIQFLICLIVGIVYFRLKQKSTGKAWLLTSLLVAAVGFSFCTLPILIVWGP